MKLKASSHDEREFPKKLDDFYLMVDNICAGKKLDYFARNKRKGWEVYGDEINE